MRLLHLGSRQSDLVRTVEGIKYTQIEGLDQCCGFGGTFSFKNPDVSGAMVEDKATNVEDRRIRMHRRRLLLPDEYRRCTLTPRILC